MKKRQILKSILLVSLLHLNITKANEQSDIKRCKKYIETKTRKKDTF